MSCKWPTYGNIARSAPAPPSRPLSLVNAPGAPHNWAHGTPHTYLSVICAPPPPVPCAATLAELGLSTDWLLTQEDIIMNVGRCVMTMKLKILITVLRKSALLLCKSPIGGNFTLTMNNYTRNTKTMTYFNNEQLHQRQQNNDLL